MCSVESTTTIIITIFTKFSDGPSGICTSVARGFVHVIYGNANKKANLVPADFCVSAMIASAWDISKRYF